MKPVSATPTSLLHGLSLSDEMKPESIKYVAPLTYYGGKKRIAEWILQFIPQHSIYCEPFFGGGAVFFAKQPSYLEVINDKNAMVVNFYRQIQENFDIVASKIQNTLHSEFQYYQAEKIYSGQISADDIDKAVATWLVFNQSWNASARAGWKFDQGSGGSHTGIVLAHARRNFCQWLRKRLQYVQISCRDALQVIRDRDSVDTFFYLDPPYPGTNQGHYAGYSWEDLESLLTILQSVKGKFALSNYPSSMISKFSAVNNWQLKETVLKKDSNMASVKDSQKIEILLMNYQISVPRQLSIF